MNRPRYDDSGEDMLYRKRGRRYYPVGREFAGFPANGVWFVDIGVGKHHRRRVEYACSVRFDAIASVEPHRDAVLAGVKEAWEKHQTQPMSQNDYADIILKHIALSIEKTSHGSEKEGDE